MKNITQKSLRKSFAERLGLKLDKYIAAIMLIALLSLALPSYALAAAEDMWTVADRIIKDVYGKIAGISQHKVDQAWDRLRRIWIAWAIINGIWAFLAYIRPLFSGLDTLS